MFIKRVSIFLMLSCAFSWQATKAQDEDCKDKVNYCSTITQYCEHPEYKSFMFANCQKACKKCPSDIDPKGLCKNSGGCDHQCNVQNKTIKECSCDVGYKLQSDKSSCEDIDECQIITCPASEYCSNTAGGFVCDKVKCNDKPNMAPYMGRAECCTREPGTATCGVLDRKSERILDGTKSYRGQWPWQVLIVIDSSILCGGTLISKEWVVTAGHCFRGYTESTTFELFFGALRVDKPRSKHVQQRAMKRHILYPNWNGTEFQINDIALIELKKPVSLGRYVKPVCLPNGERPKAGTLCYAAGWGLTEEEGTDPSAILLHVDLPIVDGDKCEKNYKNEDRKVDKRIMMCAGYDEGGKDACRGDSGGPLVCQRCSSCGWYLAGVVSFGSGCGRKNLYGVYADVPHFENWISKETSIPVTKDRSCTGPSLTQWSNWSECTKSCGSGGRHTRTRECRDKGVKSNKCDGPKKQTEDCPIKLCPSFGKWREWSECSKTCGGGTRTQYRECKNGEIGQDGCPADESTRAEDCNTHNCPSWSKWTVWGKCSQTCGGGKSERTRQCTGGQPSDTCCDGDEKESRTCNKETCPGWTDWSDWSACSKTCAKGKQTSTRKCVGKAGACSGSDEREQVCNDIGCPRFSLWSAWGKCSFTSVGCEKKATRTCINGKVGEPGCDGDTSKSETCKESECFGDWTKWSECTKSCDEGTQTRTRPCVGGTRCDGKTEETRSCQIRICPVFSEWTKWGDCSLSCGGGFQSRNRECMHTELPDECIGDANERRKCNAQKCPGKWTPWSQWTMCGVTCGEGKSERSRKCEGGLVGEPNCNVGSDKETRTCKAKPCPSSWGKWDNWSSCSKTCDRGLRTRTRQCEGGKVGSGGCVPASDAKEEKTCNEVLCEECLDGGGDQYCSQYFGTQAACKQYPTFAEQYCRKKCKLCPGLHEHWNEWESCSSTCGPGTRKRTRECKNTTSGCEGSNEETETCQASCKGFTAWSKWSSCSKSCNGGTHTRSRTCPFDKCNQDERGSSALSEEEDCNVNPCPGKWGSFGRWGACTVTCGDDGVEEQTRNCIGGTPGGPGCRGSDKNTRPCRNNPACPGKWTKWTTWSSCPVSCGVSRIERTRRCENGIPGEKGCVGTASESQRCNAGECVVKWGQWEDWGECDASCKRSRNRKCNGGQQGDRGCRGSSSQTEDCDPSLCDVSDDCLVAQPDYDSNCPNYEKKFCRTIQLEQICATTCCEALKTLPCEDDPQYKDSYCTAAFLSLCRDPQYQESIFKIYCAKSCGFC